MSCGCYSYNWDDNNTSKQQNVLLDVPEKFNSHQKVVCVDYCISNVIKTLWENDIFTLNSCCGHNKVPPSIIFDCSYEKELDKIKNIISELDDRQFKLLAWKLVEL